MLVRVNRLVRGLLIFGRMSRILAECLVALAVRT